MRRAWHLSAITPLRLGVAGIEPGTIGDGLALLRSPRAEPRAVRATGEISIRIVAGDAFDVALDTHLALQLDPMKQQGRARVGCKLAALAAGVVRIEGE